MVEKSDIHVVEVAKADGYLFELRSLYSASSRYDVSILRGAQGWKIELALKPFEKIMEKEYKGRLFEDHIEEVRVFAAELNGKRVGWIELGYDRWNNRMRVWEFLVEEQFRRKGIGTLLMNHAVQTAKDRGARMLVLETQSNNAAAIDFYLRFGFKLVGLDAAAYSNDDLGKGEVRLEFGLKLQ